MKVVSTEIHDRDMLLDFFLGHFGGDRAKSSEAYLNGGRDCATRFAGLCSEIFPDHASLNVLEFASGYGRVARYAEHVMPTANWTCCDIHPAAVEFTRRLGLTSFLSSTAPEAWSAPKKYDVVFALSFFSHMPKRTFGTWLARLFEAVVPGGVLIFTTHGEITVRSLSNTAFDDSGFFWMDHTEQCDLDIADYGVSAVTKEYVDAALRGISLTDTIRFQQGFWWKSQDLYVIRKRQAPLVTRSQITERDGPQ